MNAVYMIHGGLLYRYMKNITGDFDPVLCVPASKIDIFLELFHSSLIGGYMGMPKSVMTLQQKFYLPQPCLPSKNVYHQLSHLSNF